MARIAPGQQDMDGDGIPDLLDQHLDSHTPEQLAVWDRVMGNYNPPEMQQWDQMNPEPPAPTLDTSTETAPAQSGFDRFAQGFAGAPQGPVNNSFLGGLIGGVQGGLSRRGSQVMSERDKLAEGIAKRQAIRDASNGELTKLHQAALTRRRERRADAMLTISGRPKIQTDEQRRTAAYNTALGTQQGRAAGPQDEATMATGDLTPAGLDAAARVYASTGQLPPMGMGKSPLRAKIINRAAELDPSLNPAANKATMEAEKSNLTQLTKQQGQTKQQSATVHRNADLMLSLMAKLPDTGVPVLNAIVRPGAEKLFGSTDVSNFNTALATVQPEFARILTQGPSGGGPLSDSARHELQAMISGNFTKKQLRGAIATLKRDAANRVDSQQGEIDATKVRISAVGKAPSNRPPISSFMRP